MVDLVMGITYNDLSSWAFLRDSLTIGSNGVKVGFFRRDEHYDRNKNFYNCLLKLKEKSNDGLDEILNDREYFDIFNLEVNGIKYVHFQTILCDYAISKKKGYSKLLDDLINEVKNIIEEKQSKKLETLDEIIPYLRNSEEILISR